VRAGECLVEAFELAEPNRRLPAGASDRPAEQAQCHFGRQTDEFFGIDDDLIGAKILGQPLHRVLDGRFDRGVRAPQPDREPREAART
jgi:hypothetical protein